MVNPCTNPICLTTLNLLDSSIPETSHSRLRLHSF
jgi:hypothetical protein